MSRRLTDVRNIVRFIRICGKLTSTWPNDPESSRIVRINRDLLWFISFINVIGLVVPLILGVYHYRRDLVRLMKSLSELTALFEVFFNLILCKIQRQRLQGLLSILTNDVLNSKASDRLVYQKYVDRYMPFLVTVGTSYFLTAFVFCLGPLLMTTNLPADAWYPFSIEPTFIRYSLYVSQVIAILQTGLCLTVDFMVSMMLWYATARMEILSMRIDKMIDETELGELIAEHQRIIAFARETNYAVRFIILKGNATMALAAICGAFPLIRHEPLLVISQFILMVAGGLLRLYVTAWPADDLADMSEKLAHTVYRTRWIDGTTGMRKIVLFVIQRSQKPLVISVKGILPALTLTFYASFVSGTMSYFVTLRAVFGE